jgi:hypothetical protein
VRVGGDHPETSVGARRRAIPRATLIVVLIAGCAAGVALAGRWTRAPARAFDPVRWREANLATGDVRQPMADGLLERGDLLGLSRAEVGAMLGEPPPTAYFSEWDMVYLLGPERGYVRIDSEWLVIRLSEEGRVAEARIVAD